MPKPTTALLLIDVQQSFRARPVWREDEVPAFLSHTHALIQGCQSQGVPIVRVLHEDGPAHADNPFATASGLVRPLDGLMAFEAAHTVRKRRHSALAGTDLGVWLREHGVQRLIVAGIRTEQCCETTARHASDEGWTVDFVSDAMLTFDMTTPTGAVLGAAAIRERTETVLAGRFVTLCTVEQALTRAASAR